MLTQIKVGQVWKSPYGTYVICELLSDRAMCFDIKITGKMLFISVNKDGIGDISNYFKLISENYCQQDCCKIK